MPTAQSTPLLAGMVGMDAKQLGARLRQRREALDMSQQDIAKRMGRKQAAVSKWEVGDTNITVADFCRLAEILGTTPAELLRDEDGPEPERRSRGRPKHPPARKQGKK
jgi:transcriptional regulator with XRE-family HTH domain